MPIVCIDPGHGGKDPGAIGGVMEKGVNLGISLAMAERLKIYGGVEVAMTRSGDTTVSLQGRCDIANGAGADVFVSIHCNSGGDHGFESFVAPHAKRAAEFQDAIHAELSEWYTDELRANTVPLRLLTVPMDLVPDRGQKEAHFIVLINTRMPAILVECGFVDHPEDSEYLTDLEFQARLGYSLADGVVKILGVKPEEYVCSIEFEDAVAWARSVGLSSAPKGHDYREPISEERLLALLQRVPRLLEVEPKWKRK